MEKAIYVTQDELKTVARKLMPRATVPEWSCPLTITS